MKKLLHLFAMSVLTGSLVQAAPLGTAFTYQGRLTDGGHPANGSYDLTFMLFATNNGGVSVAGPITNMAVAVSHGLFTVALDFGEGVFTGDARWLDIAVCTNGAGAFTTLPPRQRLSPSPYALFANGASNAVNAATADVANSANSVSAANITGTLPNGVLPASPTFIGTVTAGAFSGNGGGMTNLDAGNLTGGTVPDALLSTNVALLTSCGISVVLTTNVLPDPMHPNTNVAYVTGGMSVGVSNGVYVWSEDIGALTNHGVGLTLSPETQMWVFTNATFPDPSWTGRNFAAIDMDGNMAASDEWYSNDVETVIIGMSASFGTNYLTLVRTNVTYGSNVVGSFQGSGAQLTGIPLSGLATAPLTNKQTDVTLSGTFSGNMSGGTDLTLPLYPYYAGGSSYISATNWTNCIGLINSTNANKTFRLEMDGTGLVAAHLLNGAWERVTNYFPLAGLLNANTLGTASGCSGAAQFKAGKDGFWYNSYNQTTNINGTNAFFGANLPWNIVEVDVVAETNGGSLKLQTNGLAGFADTGWTLSCTNSTVIGKSAWWTNPAGPQNLLFQLVSTTAGTNRIVNCAFWDSTIHNGIIVGMQALTSSHSSDELVVSNTISAPIYSNWAPNIILWESPESLATMQPVTNWVGFYTNNCPKATIVLCGQYPLASGLEIDANAFMLQVAHNYGVNYFDGWTPFHSYAEFSARGLIGADGTHFTTAGGKAYGYYLTQFLQLYYTPGRFP